MALPKLDVPIYELTLPSTGKKISYRPFLVKEEKILLMAMEGEDEGEIINSIKQIINNCITTEKLDVDALPLFDIEYLLLNLRARSIGDVVKTAYSRKGCTNEKCTPIELEIDVNTIEIHRDPKHNAKIELTKDVGITLKYPNIKMMTKMDNLVEGNTEDVMKIVASCIDTIYDEEGVYSKSDYTPKELTEFIDGLTQNQFKKIEEFFETIPTMYKDVELNCEKCGFKEEVRLEGLTSFFA